MFERPSHFSSWGRTEQFDYPIAHPRFASDVPQILRAPDRPGSVLAIGRGRSGGDACLNSDGGIIDLSGLNRFNRIDKAGAVLRAQAGLTIDEALRILTPRGLTLPVVPGTRHVTLGGAVASDIHGMNHRAAGTFGRWVRALGLQRSDRDALAVTPGDGEGLFAATLGGLGLTGIITWVEVNLAPLESSDLEAEDIVFGSIDDCVALFAEHADKNETVAWIDCASPGRGVFTHATPLPDGGLREISDTMRIPAPPAIPSLLVNSLSVAATGRLYAAIKRARRGPYRRHYAGFRFPLDRIANWNRLYGKRGHWTYQCALPREAAREASEELLRAAKRGGEGAMGGAMKDFGPLRSPGLLSFPVEGLTLALRFRNRGDKSLRLLDTFDTIVMRAGGRLYPAMDGRMPAQVFQYMYPNWRELEARRDPAIRSNFWTRVSAP